MQDDQSELFGYKEDDYEDRSFYEMHRDLNQDFNDPSYCPFTWQKSPSEEDENCSMLYFQQECTQDQNQDKPIGNICPIDNKKTKPTTMTNPVKEKKEEKTEIIVPNLIQEENEIKLKELLNKKKGRKSKEDNSKSNEHSVHTKKKEDNIMRKIKVKLIEFCVKFLNDSLKDKTEIFYKIDKSISENLKRDFNLKLMEQTLLYIFSTSGINGRYKNHSNVALIQKILLEGKEEETIKLLNKKYIEMVYMIQENHLDEFLRTIERKEINMEKSSVDEYMNSLKKVFMEYENWFKDKKGRNRDSSSKK